jgi:hypothetical protein
MARPVWPAPALSGSLCPFFLQGLTPLRRRPRRIGGDALFFSKPRGDGVQRIDYPLGGPDAELFSARRNMAVGHLAPKRARLGRHELAPR